MALRCHVARAVSVDQLSQSITGWDQVYDQTAPGRFHGELTELLLGPAQLFVESSSHALVQTCRTWPEAVWFGIPAHAERIGRIEGARIDRGMLAVRTGRSDFQLSTPNDFVFLGIVVEAGLLQRQLDQHGCAELSSQLAQQRVLHVPEAALDTLRRWLVHMLQASATLPAGTLTPTVRAQILDETLAGLMHLLTHRQPGPRETLSSEHSRRVMRRAHDYLRAHADQCITVAQLCDELGTSRRALQDCFRRSMDIAPKTYLRAVGLNAARRELRRADSRCTTVGDVAARHGFWHLSQFAGDYRRLFGELPSETLRQRAR